MAWHLSLTKVLSVSAATALCACPVSPLEPARRRERLARGSNGSGLFRADSLDPGRHVNLLTLLQAPWVTLNIGAPAGLCDPAWPKKCSMAKAHVPRTKGLILSSREAATTNMAFEGRHTVWHIPVVPGSSWPWLCGHAPD